MRILTPIALLLFVAACGAGNDGTQTSDEWIEVPLANNVYRENPPGSSFRQDTMEIDVLPGPGLEIKLAMREGDAIVYSWEATGVDRPEQLVSEFHGHTERVSDEPGTVMFYRKATGVTDRGALVAPFDGVHGWFLRNDSYSPVVVRLTVAGFYAIAEPEP